MLGASKILTVSYGTFSCTLEGFDEPFNTMKAIAEYFRDLAAEDRYFGAEPPTPDAAMLHKIAEREIQRRVEAKIQDNGVILRAESSDLAQQATASLSRPAPAPMPPSLAPVASPAVEANGESISARLARLRASPGLTEPVPAMQTIAPQEPPEPVPNWAATRESAASGSAERAAASQEVGEAQPALPHPNPLAGLEEDYIEDQHAGEMGPDMLASVEALVAKPAILEPEFTPEPEAEALPEPALVPEPEPEAAAKTALAQTDAAEPIAAPAAAAAAAPEAIAPLDETEALLAKLAREIAAEPAVQAEVVAQAEAAPSSEAAAARAQSAEEALAEALGIAPPEARAMIGAADPAPQTDPTPRAAQAPPADPAPEDHARARLIRVRRIEPSAPRPAGAKLLSDEAEVALLAELANLRDEARAPVPTAEAEAEAKAAPQRPSRPLRVLRPDPASPTPKILVQTLSPLDAAELRQGLSDLSKDEAVNRLIEKTNTALDDPESRRRSAAISHLKAAVAATEADRQLQDGAGASTMDRKSVYRNDLNSVVRPNSAARSGEDRPSPLVLVSEQRIDRPKAVAPSAVQPQRPVRPTRLVPASLTKAPLETLIGADLEDEEEDEALTPEEASANLFAEGTSFAEFAEQLGAQNLHDLLEAAAVYCAQILGRPQFSRPLVMSQINTLPNAQKHRLEDQLRAFGTLMREGRIKKIKRGGFAITDRSPLLAEALRNAG